jgi:CDP-glycerol glycerophosphotransferase
LLLYPHVHNVTDAPDITEYLFAADAMISDYTSAMFDFAILRKPCFIYAIDKDKYDRGFYWRFDQLPFPFAESENQLIDNIKSFHMESYINTLNTFINEIWGLDEDGQACKRLYDWMEEQR